MNSKLKAVGKFTRLIDSDNTLSLTSIALVIILFKIALAPGISLTEIGGLFIALLSYQSKKVINNKAPKLAAAVEPSQVEELKQKFEEVQSKVTALTLATGFKR